LRIDPSMHPRLLLISPRYSYRIAAYLRAAEDLGIDVLVASNGKHSLIGALKEGLHIEPADLHKSLERILRAGDARPFSGVVGSDDESVELADRVAQALNLPGNPPAAALYARRKDLARTRLKDAGLPVPSFALIDIDRAAAGELPDVPFPLVIKPLSMSASRGVIRADDAEAFCAAIQRIRPIVERLGNHEERNTLLAEAYLTGVEVALEGILTDGKLSVLALFDKPDPLEGPFFEETYYITPSRLKTQVQQQIADRVAEACAAYGLREGPVHAELRINDEDIWIVEVAARTIGGQCGRLLRFGTGYTLEQLVVSYAVGRPLPLEAQTGAAGVLMIPIPRAGVLRRVEGILAAQKVLYIEDIEISVREGYELVPLPEGDSYLGFMFARAPTAETAEQALREAHSRLKIITAPVWKIAGVPSP
jgi:biotin carboxylase